MAFPWFYCGKKEERGGGVLAENTSLRIGDHKLTPVLTPKIEPSSVSERPGRLSVGMLLHT